MMRFGSDLLSAIVKLEVNESMQIFEHVMGDSAIEIIVNEIMQLNIGLNRSVIEGNVRKNFDEKIKSMLSNMTERQKVFRDFLS